MIKGIEKLCDTDDQREIEQEPQGNLQGRKARQIEDEDLGGYNPIPVIFMNAVATVIVFIFSKVLWDANMPR